jgi:hypothetical protein
MQETLSAAVWIAQWRNCVKEAFEMLSATTRAGYVDDVAIHGPISKHRHTMSPSKEAGRNSVTSTRSLRFFLNVTVFFAFMTLMVCSLSAQETRATLAGTVFDPSHATIVGSN